MKESFKQQLCDILDKAAKKLNLANYSLNLNLDAVKGDGFLGEFYKVSITDRDTNFTHYLAVKKAPTEKVRREESNIEWVYKNEIFFYTQLYPALQRFEKEQQSVEPFTRIPGFITSCSEVGREIIVFKDITYEGFELRQRSLLLDDELTRCIFKTYGHFHAISFCMKEKEPEEFEKLTKGLQNLWLMFSERPSFKGVLEKIAEKAFEGLDPNEDSGVREEYRKYLKNSLEIFKESLRYEGEYFGIVHGDCWSNNMMFKYQQNKLIDINLLDFQLIATGTPVYDLSYFFYTGGSKELFDKLEEYLDIYHASFSKAAINLDCDPKKLLPRNVLTEDWKKYSKFGMILASILTKIKLISKEDSVGMIDDADNAKSTDDLDNGDKFMEIKYDEDLFKKRVRDILVHMYEINAL